MGMHPIVTPFPGTPLFDECKNKNLFVEKFDYNNLLFSKSNIKLPDTSPEELENIRRDVWHEEFNKRRQILDVKESGFKRFKDYNNYETAGFSTKFDNK